MTHETIGKRRLSRRRVLAGGAAGAGLLLAGCGGNTKATTNGASSSNGARTAVSGSGAGTPAPKRGGTLALGHLADIVPATLPYQMSPQNYAVLFNVFDVLAMYSPTSATLRSRLAQSWTVAPDGLSLTVKLRPGITFQDGKPITSDVIKQNIQLIGKPEAKSQASGLVAKAKTFDTTAPDTLVIHFDQPAIYFTDIFPVMPIIDPSNLDQVHKAAGINGSGPFSLASWNPGSSLQMKRWEKHWDAANTYLDTIERKVFPNAQSMGAALESGQLQIATDLTYSDYNRYKNASALQILSDPGLNNDNYIGLVTDFGPFKDPRVRQALAYSVDRDRLNKEVFFGLEDKRNFLWPPTSPAYEAQYANVYDFNLDKARQLMSDAGLSSGFSGAIPLTVTTAAPETITAAQIIQSSAKQIGLNFTIDQVEYANFLTQLSTSTFKAAWIAQLGYLGGYVASAYLESFPIRLHSPSHIDKQPEGQKYSDLINQVAQLKPNDPTAKQVYSALDTFLVEQSFLIPFASHKSIYGASKKVHGFEANASSLPFYGHTSMS